MASFWLGLLSAALATNHVAAVSNYVAKTTGIRLPVTDTSDPVEREYLRILKEDDAALDEIDRWIRDAENQAKRSGGLESLTLKGRIEQRLAPVLDDYKNFLARHPNHLRARLAFGSFLNQIGRPAEALRQWQKAKEIAPNDPVPWNNLGAYYGHWGPIPKAFECFERAIRLAPGEALYYRNLASVVSTYWRDAKDYYKLSDTRAAVRKALAIYDKALRLQPKNFVWAVEAAQNYYFFKPEEEPTPEARRKLLRETLAAWERARKIAPDDLARQGVAVHIARAYLRFGLPDKAEAELRNVTHPAFAALRARLLKRAAEVRAGRSPKPSGPSSPAPAASKPPSG